METPSFKEDHISQIPALQLLINMGYNYLNQGEVLKTADQEITLLTSQRNQLQLHKNGLMQQLLTGKKRMKV
jgi:hypothetical protein